MTNPSNLVATPVQDTNDWEQNRVAHERLVAALRPRNKAMVFDALAVAGITIVTVSFDGYGDSGQIESIEAQAGSQVVDLPQAKLEINAPIWGKSEPEKEVVSVAVAIERLVYDYLSDAHGGWENNEGAYGEFTFDVGEKTISLDYNERFMSTEHYSYEF